MSLTVIRDPEVRLFSCFLRGGTMGTNPQLPEHQSHFKALPNTPKQPLYLCCIPLSFPRPRAGCCSLVGMPSFHSDSQSSSEIIVCSPSIFTCVTVVPLFRQVLHVTSRAPRVAARPPTPTMEEFLVGSLTPAQV